jgi:D-alanine-D-alanine ligase
MAIQDTVKWKPAAGHSKRKQTGRATGSRKAVLGASEASLKKLRLVAVAYSHVEREFFPTDEAYEAEREVIDRAAQVVEELTRLGVQAKGYPGDPYFLTNLLVDKPDLVLNLVDTLHGKDSLQSTVPAALELAGIPYTGAGIQGMVIGNDRHFFKQLLEAAGVPTAPYQYLPRKGLALREGLEPPFIVKLNEGGGSVGIDAGAVKETIEEARARADEMIETYKLPVVVEHFVDGPEVTAVLFDSGRKRHVFLAERKFRKPVDGKHYFTSFESYDDKDDHKYLRIDPALEARLAPLVERAFVALKFKDYAKFDIRLDEATSEPFVTDANPNTAFGPDPKLPFTEVLALYGVTFREALASLISKHARRLSR